jgi:DNA repair exonuclease SbcCD ATPase subunit
VIAEKLRKAELELESEKRRRAILESELDNDSRQVPMQPMPGYPMFSQFGYPPMMSYNTDRSSDKKSRLLEVDLAAERENKEALEKTVSELTAALEQEKHALKTQRESLIATHEREMNEVFTELKKKEDDVAELSDIAKEFRSVAEELSQTKLQLDEKSKLADAYEKTRDDLLGEKSTSAALSSNLANVQDSLDQKVKEYNELIDQHERMKKLHEEVASYYEYEIQQLKVSNKESNELLEAKIATIEEMKSANRRLEEEMSEASAVHRAHIARLEQELAEVSDNMKSEMDNLARLKSKELSESKSQLKNALQELQSVYSAKETAEQEARDLKIAVEEKNEEFIEVLANNEALCVDVEGLRSMSENSDRELNEAKDKIKSLTVENSNLEIEMDRMKAQLSDIKQENTMYGEQFADLERVLDQMDSKLVNAETTLQEREAALKVAEDRLASNQRDIDAREKDAELIYDKYTELETSFHRILSSVIHKFDSLLPQSETSESSLESLEEKKIHITALATLVSNQMKEKDRQIQEVNFDMSNALRELDTLESKYKQTRADLAASMDACKDEQQLENDYDELMRYVNYVFCRWQMNHVPQS